MAAAKKKDKGNALAIPVEERLGVMNRIEAGERAAAIALEYGVSRQYVSLLWKKYNEEGPEAVLSAKRGRRRTRRLTVDERKKLGRLVDKDAPSKYGLPGEFLDEELELWTVESLRALVERKFGFVPNKGDVKTILFGRGLPVSMGDEPLVGKRTPGDPHEPGQVVPSLAGFQATPVRGTAAPKVTKPPKVTPGPAAAQAAPGEPVKRGRGRPRKRIDELEVDLEELERIRKRIEAGEPVMPQQPARGGGGPGVRVGKNRGSKSPIARKKRRKKGRK